MMDIPGFVLCSMNYEFVITKEIIQTETEKLSNLS